MKLCIDAGHGNANKAAGKYDPGACAGGVAEADVTLAWALSGKWVLTQGGVLAWLTRDDDRDPDPVSTRADRAEASGCTHFLSLHANAGPAQASGVETFYRDEADLRFARLVHVAMLAATGLRDRGIRNERETEVGRLAVMGFDGPCALVEIGYLTNKMDRQVMQTRDVRIAFWRALIPELRRL